MYGDAIFATQMVVEGQYAAVPMLQPSVAGSWEFDFTQVITGDVVITWIAE